MKTLLENISIFGKKSNILIEDQIISSLGEMPAQQALIFKLGGLFAIPGCIDPHTHIRDLGQSYKEDWNSASQAALAGGYTMVFDMPNTIPPTTTPEHLQLKRNAAKKATIHKKFFLGATNHNIHEVEKMLATRAEDIAGIKLFMAGSSSNEVVDKEEDLIAYARLAKQYDKVLAVHSENQACIQASERLHADKDHARWHNTIRSRECAILSTRQILDISAKVGNELYLVHTSLAEEIDMVRQHKAKGTRVWCEIMPHHLLLDESILETAGNYGKVNPPIRTARDNEALWEAIRDGTVDTLGSDHAPHSLEEKARPYAQAPSGFPGLETSLALMLNQVKLGNISLERVVELTSQAQNRIFRLGDRGLLKPGAPADLAIIDLDARHVVEPARFRSKAKYSPYQGMELWGKVMMTLVDGEIRYKAPEMA